MFALVSAKCYTYDFTANNGLHVPTQICGNSVSNPFNEGDKLSLTCNTQFLYKVSSTASCDTYCNERGCQGQNLGKGYYTVSLNSGDDGKSFAFACWDRKDGPNGAWARSCTYMYYNELKYNEPVQETYVSPPSPSPTVQPTPTVPTVPTELKPSSWIDEIFSWVGKVWQSLKDAFNFGSLTSQSAYGGNGGGSS